MADCNSRGSANTFVPLHVVKVQILAFVKIQQTPPFPTHVESSNQENNSNLSFGIVIIGRRLPVLVSVSSLLHEPYCHQPIFASNISAQLKQPR